MHFIEGERGKTFNLLLLVEVFGAAEGYKFIKKLLLLLIS